MAFVAAGFGGKPGGRALHGAGTTEPEAKTAA